MSEGTRQIESEAALWVERIEAAGADPELVAARDAWLARSPWHRVVYVRMAHFWPQVPPSLQSGEHLTESGAVDCEYNEPPGAHRHPVREVLDRSLELARRQFGCAAALVFVLVGCIGLYWQRPLLDTGSILYASTSASETSAATPFMLSDGSRIDLGHAGKVEVQYSHSHRKVKLISGRARFTVSHDPNRSFEVVAGQVVTRALGTRFTVRLDGDMDVTVAVEQGRVRVECRRALPVSSSFPESNCGSELSAGDSVEIQFGKVALSVVTEQNTTLGPASGRNATVPARFLYLNGEPLDRAVEWINQYSTIQLRIVDRAIASRALGGAFRLQGDLAGSFAGALGRMGIKARISELDPQQIDLMRDECGDAAEASASSSLKMSCKFHD